MDRTLKRGYSLQFCSVPPPFMGMREVNLSSQEEMGFLSAEIQALVQKQAVSEREKGLYSMYFLVLKKTGELGPILVLHGLNRHISCRKFRMLTMKQSTRVFFYLDDLIVMAGSWEQAMFCTARLITHLTKLGFAINWKKSTYLTNRRCIWEWCSMQTRCVPPCVPPCIPPCVPPCIPPCQRADVRPFSGWCTGCDRGQQ